VRWFECRSSERYCGSAASRLAAFRLLQQEALAELRVVLLPESAASLLVLVALRLALAVLLAVLLQAWAALLLALPALEESRGWLVSELVSALHGCGSCNRDWWKGRLGNRRSNLWPRQQQVWSG